MPSTKLQYIIKIELSPYVKEKKLISMMQRILLIHLNSIKQLTGKFRNSVMDIYNIGQMKVMKLLKVHSQVWDNFW